jgi:ABC-type phosphate/phosphonate transport system substrate-binding protein
MLLTAAPATAQDRLIVGIHDNLILQEQKSRAKRALEHLIQLIGDEVGVPMELEILTSGTQPDLLKTAAKLRSGQVHVAAMTGLEYGWLRDLAGRGLQPLVISNAGLRTGESEQLIVREGGKQLQELRGAKLAVFAKPYPSAHIYLRQLQRARGSDFLSGRTAVLSNASKALQAVLSGGADAAIIDTYTLQGYQRVFPGQAARLRIVDRTKSYPMVPVVGFPQHMNRIRAGLWGEVQTELTRVHTNPRAAAFLEVWRVRGFNMPPGDYDRSAAQAAKDFPLNELQVDEQD